MIKGRVKTPLHILRDPDVSQSESNDAISAVSAEPISLEPKRRRRNPWRLRTLLTVSGLLAFLFVVSQLEPTQVAMLGRPGKFAHELFNPPVEPEISPLGKRLISDVKALGGQVQVMGRSRQYLGLLGNTERFMIWVPGSDLDDRALERFVTQYGERICGLDLRNTKVTDDGLRHLAGVSQLSQLTLGNDDVRFTPLVPRPISPITEAGLIHLRVLRQLGNLDLSGLPITDVGLDAIKDLPILGELSLSRTKIKGPGLARLTRLPMLTSLNLAGSEIDDDGLQFLSGARNLRHLYLRQTMINGPGLAHLSRLPMLTSLDLDESYINDEGLTFLTGAPKLKSLSLDGVPLTGKGLKALKGLPRLGQLNVNRTGLSDEEVMGLRMSKPALKVQRR